MILSTVPGSITRVKQLVAATLTVPTSSTTSLTPTTRSEIFPECANLDSGILADIMIRDMLLPSTIPLSKVFQFFVHIQIVDYFAIADKD
jgi:hypothetical protein